MPAKLSSISSVRDARKPETGETNHALSALTKTCTKNINQLGLLVDVIQLTETVTLTVPN